MVLDYCERRPVSKNRPKKQPLGVLTFVLAGVVLLAFVSGFGAGWFFCNRSVKKNMDQKIATATSQAGVSAALQPPQQKPAPQEVPLTFYQTLPSGAKTVIGSGLNPGKADLLSKKPAVLEHQEPSTAPLPKASGVPEESRPATPATQGLPDNASTKGAGDSSFCVQVASVRDRKDADAIKTRLVAKGLAAYIVESTVQEKGTWFRVRLGKHLTRAEASELAAKAGKGAIISPD